MDPSDLAGDRVLITVSLTDMLLAEGRDAESATCAGELNVELQAEAP